MSDRGESWRVRWDEDAQIVRTEWAKDTVCTLEDAEAIDAATRALDRGPVLDLVDIRGLASIDRAAREYFTRLEEGYRAVALLVDSAPSRMLANFFIGLRRTATPLRLFSSEAEAIDWLRAQP